MSTPILPALKLDLACGRHCREGFDGVDIATCDGAPIKVADGEAPRKHPDVKHVVNLLSFPWPWTDGSVGEAHCSHFLEHLPELFWHPHPMGHALEGIPAFHAVPFEWTRHLLPFQVDDRSVELFLKFMDELHRILAPGAHATIQVPHGRSSRAFWDPSHRRFLQEQTFTGYLSKPWRRANGLEHAAYGVSCDFEVAVQHLIKDYNYVRSVGPEDDASFQPWIASRLDSYWNVADDMIVVLTKKVPVAASAKEAKEAVAPAT